MGVVCIFAWWQKLKFRSDEPSRATLVRVAFDYSTPSQIQKKSHPLWVALLLEQGTGVEPAQSAWEAEILPIN